MKLLFILVLLINQATASSLGSNFIDKLCLSRPVFLKYLGNRKFGERDPKNVVASWIITYIDLLHKDYNKSVFFDSSLPENQLSDYITRNVQESNEIIIIRVANDPNQRFENVFFSMIGSLIKLQNNTEIQALKKRYFNHDEVDKEKILTEIVKLDHLTLFRIGELRKKDFKEWGDSYELFMDNSHWDIVDEKNFDIWQKDPANLKFRNYLFNNAKFVYANWETSR